ncbi:MAG: HAD-IC family P-type ATPase, partial [Patescibacteria group bacterium]|nr:HAD-IC family P-type ATPase [Patescibacteria group bacterium]
MSSSGLTSRAASQYLTTFGYNEIPQKRESLFHKVARQSASPISAMLFAAALLSFIGGKTFDGGFILILLIANVLITALQEHKADTAIEKLNEHITSSVRVLRDGAWVQITSRLLVPKDLIELRAGNVVPADLRVAEANNLSTNEAAVTGESLPKEKAVGELLYSGSFVSSGLVRGEIVATGGNTRFGATLKKAEGNEKKSSLEENILRISRFLSILSLAAAAILTVILWEGHGSIVEILRLDLSLLIAGIPISLPAVMTLIIAFGVIALSKKQVVVRRLSSLEDLANTDFLLTDKTGTLTQNKIQVDEVISYGAVPQSEVLRLASAIAQEEPDTVMNAAILEKTGSPSGQTRVSYIPGDSERKRSTLVYTRDAEFETLSLGAPRVIADLCLLGENTREAFGRDIDRLAERGYRSIALARARGDAEKNMELLGLLSLSDTLREDAAGVISFLQQNGIGVAMVTGDDRAIAKEIARKLNIPGSNILSREDLLARGFKALQAKDFENTQAFAQILPEDKLELVKAAGRYFTVAANGDGVNDLPAVKAASVGFAVANAVDALKGAADIVLLSPGIAVMRDAFLEGRKIFARLYSYSLYRISESFRLIVTIAFLGILIGSYPLSPLQLILIALLNDLPIISLAFDRVKLANRPSTINV